MKFLKFLILIVIFSNISCENELDIEPQQSVSTEVATATAANIEAILTGAYDSARSGDPTFGGGNYDGDLANIAVLYGNTDQIEWNGTFANLRELFNKELDNVNGSANGMWRDAYLLFGAVNTVLANLDKFEDEDQKNRVEGEAMFLRGLAYFDIIRLYGQQYNAGGGNTQPGVPIVLDPPSLERLVPRNSVEEVYTQIVQDLTSAYSKLPDTNGDRADKYAAQAVLARVYLQQGNYAAARDAADDVIQNSGHSLMPDFNAVFDSDDNTAESIFSFVVTNQEGANRQVQHFASEALGGRGGDISIAQAYIDKFDSAADERRNYTYTDGGLTLSSKFVRQFANTQQIRLAEMHLIRAECNFRESTTIGQAPLAEINALRARSSAPALGVLTIDLILNERELELGFEGFVLHDYKRTQRNIGGLPYNDNKLVFPVPQQARDRNDLLEQNPGY
ncbi:RagB/SusD family nutrient uptake outer membrane protein [Aquimarina sp. AU58]|uniref:RagB/SusD family nutrient uptake outer membrane protein n=1 Tax=Aquimarina sp. AU58 TaxID=1874112 RepID=UPI000D647D7C|nr:RagB/SusD family nutrient uptake outer membrane protein [Aquimarina sp. AU58]